MWDCLKNYNHKTIKTDDNTLTDFKINLPPPASTAPSNLKPGEACATWTDPPDKKPRRVLLSLRATELTMIEQSNQNKTVWPLKYLRKYGSQPPLCFGVPMHVPM